MSDLRVLVTGANGFIGRHVVAELLGNGHEVVAASRRPDETGRRFPTVRSIDCDFRFDTTPGVWRSRLAGIDAVVNCVGILEGRDSRRVHADAPAALFSACESAGVRRVVHLSAISAEDTADTDYAHTKRTGERALEATNLDWVILRPSLVYGEGSYGGSSLLRGLAGLPFVIPLPGRGDQTFSPIHVEDLAKTVSLLLGKPQIKRVALAPVGPETVTTRDILLRLRAWLDLPAAPCLAIPMPILRLAGTMGALIGLKTLRPTAIQQIEHGNAGPVEAFVGVIGFTPRSMVEMMASRPSHVQDRWHARLYFVQPALRLVLGLTWIAAGLIGLIGVSDAADRFAPGLGIPAGIAATLFTAFCLVDIAVGAAVLGRWHPMAATLVQIALVVAYTAVLTLIAPMLWLDPLGALVKNGAIIVAVLALAAMDSDR